MRVGRTAELRNRETKGNRTEDKDGKIKKMRRRRTEGLNNRRNEGLIA